MADTTTYKSANVTKAAAGGSGDNYIGDGIIKSVEKIWTDSYTSTADLSTACCIVLADLPTNKKVTSIEVTIETLSTQSTGQIALGTTTDTCGAMTLEAINHALTVTTISFPVGGVQGVPVDGNGQLNTFKPVEFPYVTDGGDVCLILEDWVATYAAITSIVRYT